MNKDEMLHIRKHSPIVYLHMLSIGVPKDVAKMILDIGGNPKNVPTGVLYKDVQCMWCDRYKKYIACTKSYNNICLHVNGHKRKPMYFCCSKGLKKRKKK